MLQTFGDGKESDRYHAVAMRTTEIIVDVADGHVHRMILLISCTHGDGSLVGTENDRQQHRSVRGRVFGYEGLQKMLGERQVGGIVSRLHIPPA